jgi:hypothetical protein
MVNKWEYEDMKDNLRFYGQMETSFDYLRLYLRPPQVPQDGPPPAGNPPEASSGAMDVDPPSKSSVSEPPWVNRDTDGQETVTGYGETESMSLLEDLAFQHGVGKGKMLFDQAGKSRFHGATSGATFLDGLKQFIVFWNPERMAAGQDLEDLVGLEPEGLYQTDDSRPLLLPPEAEVDKT